LKILFFTISTYQILTKKNYFFVQLLYSKNHFCAKSVFHVSVLESDLKISSCCWSRASFPDSLCPCLAALWAVRPPHAAKSCSSDSCTNWGLSSTLVSSSKASGSFCSTSLLPSRTDDLIKLPYSLLFSLGSFFFFFFFLMVT